MKETLESLRHKINMAKELNSVVRTMKALSASSINQYERSVQSLEDYYQTVKFGLSVCLPQAQKMINPATGKNSQTGVIIFGSGQGLVGQFNDIICQFMIEKLEGISGEKKVWAVGHSLHRYLEDSGWNPELFLEVPHTVGAITPLVSRLLFEIENSIEKGEISEVYLFYNHSRGNTIYSPENLRIIPLDASWSREFTGQRWPSNKVPEAIVETETTLAALIREYFFVTLFRASAESLASENASRLAAMQRAEKNIKDLLNDLTLTFHQLRKNSIDEEMFDVIFGSEAQQEGF